MQATLRRRYWLCVMVHLLFIAGRFGSAIDRQHLRASRIGMSRSQVTSSHLHAVHGAPSLNAPKLSNTIPAAGSNNATWLPLQLQTLRSFHEGQRKTTVVFSENDHQSAVTTPVPSVAKEDQAIRSGSQQSDFAAQLRKLREQRNKLEGERILQQLAMDRSEKNRFDRGDMENAKATRIASKAAAAIQMETARQREVGVTLLAVLTSVALCHNSLLQCAICDVLAI